MFVLNRPRAAIVPGILVLLAAAAGCQSSSPAPRAPRIQIQGPAGTPVAYSVTYLDGDTGSDTTGSVKTIPTSGVYTEELKTGHDGVVVQVGPIRQASATVTLYDGDRELMRSTASGNAEIALVQAGKVRAVEPLQRP